MHRERRQHRLTHRHSNTLLARATARAVTMRFAAVSTTTHAPTCHTYTHTTYTHHAFACPQHTTPQHNTAGPRPQTPRALHACRSLQAVLREPAPAAGPLRCVAPNNLGLGVSAASWRGASSSSWCTRQLPSLSNMSAPCPFLTNANQIIQIGNRCITCPYKILPLHSPRSPTPWLFTGQSGQTDRRSHHPSAAAAWEQALGSEGALARSVVQGRTRSGQGQGQGQGQGHYRHHHRHHRHR